MSAVEPESDITAFHDLLKFLQQTPNTLSQLTDGLTPEQLRTQDSDGLFSALENICHLRDLEINGYTPRIQRMLAETNPALTDFDGARVAALGNYHGEDKDEALHSFASARNANVQTLRQSSPAQLSRVGSLEGVGEITLYRLAEMMREHDEGHLHDLSVLRRRMTVQSPTSNVQRPRAS